MEKSSERTTLNKRGLKYWIKQKKIALALSIFRDLLKSKRVINILPILQAYFNKRRYFPILMSTFAFNLRIWTAGVIDSWYFDPNTPFKCICISDAKNFQYQVEVEAHFLQSQGKLFLGIKIPFLLRIRKRIQIQVFIVKLQKLLLIILSHG